MLRTLQRSIRFALLGLTGLMVSTATLQAEPRLRLSGADEQDAFLNNPKNGIVEFIHESDKIYFHEGKIYQEDGSEVPAALFRRYVKYKQFVNDDKIERHTSEKLLKWLESDPGDEIICIEGKSAGGGPGRISAGQLVDGKLIKNYGKLIPYHESKVVVKDILPFFRRKVHFDVCIRNTKEIGRALEFWSIDHQDDYPISLSQLTPRYLSVVPDCPAAKADTYSDTFESSNEGRRSYSFFCRGKHHQGMKARENFPAYDSEKGCTIR